jgi:hypothetical protein
VAVSVAIFSLHSLAMGEETDGSAGAAGRHGGTGVMDGPAVDGLDRAAAAEPDRTQALEFVAGRRRFTVAALLGTFVAAIPFVWILWGPWETPDPIRKSAYEDNFYSLQARAMFHGHLWLANGAIGIEAFVHDSRQYTYFGIFPSLIRMPILLLTSRLDTQLTVPYMLAAWLLTALFVSLLLWRVRLLVRGPVVMGRAEATAYGVLIATTLVGSVFTILASLPYVFAEDLAWSICLTVGSLFALLGLLERPSRGRVVAAGLLILCANLDRLTTGWACVVGAVLVAAWFGLGRGGQENRRWCVPILAAGLIPLLVGCFVNYLKFGVPFGLPVVDQVWTFQNAYRRKFLAANHNSEEGLAFIPSDALAYLRLDGLRFTSVFPFVTLPAAPATAVSGVLFDRRYRTASMPSSMPLLFLLSVWGMVTAFRPRPFGRVALTRIPLLAAGSAGAALLLWGYIAPRYLADFVPFLVLAGAVALADIWRRLEGRTRRLRIGTLAVIALVALFTIVANIGIAVVPNEEWTPTQVLNFVEVQKSISDVTGHPLNAEVHRGSQLPPWAPAGELYVIGDCDGLYISNGENYSTIPSQQFTRTTWMAVQRGHAYQRTFSVTAHHLVARGIQWLPMLAVGPSDTVSAKATPSRFPGQVQVSFNLVSPGHITYGLPTLITVGTSVDVVVITDPVKHLVEVTIRGMTFLTKNVDQVEPVSVLTGATQPAPPPALTAADVTPSSPQPRLCQSLSG